MLNPTPLSEYITLGQHLRYLNLPPSQSPIKEISETGTKFIYMLSKYDLPDTADVARSLSNITLQFDHRIQGLSNPSRSKLDAAMQAINMSLYREAGTRHMIALKASDVSTRLRNLPNALPSLNVTQHHLLDETIRCIECEAYRSATVMGWNLAFDVIRQWVFDNRLGDFNKSLTTGYFDRKKGVPRYLPIGSYDDFFYADPAPGERVVLDCLLDANIIGGNPHQDLCKHLRQRNATAHANAAIPTANKTNAFLEELIDIITAPPFKK